jgi:hypothetical protein
MSLATEILADSPLNYWDLHETTGNGGDQGSSPTTMTPTGTYSQSNAGFGTLGNAWSFSGAGYATASKDYSALTVLTFELMLNWTSYGTANKVAVYYGANFAIAHGFAVMPDYSTGAFLTGLGGDFRSWQDTFTRPSAAAWHHYVFVYDRNTPANKAYVDGSPMSLTVDSHTAYSYGNFGNEAVTLFADGGGGSLGTGKVQHVAAYSGELSSARVSAHATAAGVTGGGGTAVDPPFPRYRTFNNVRLRR